MTASEQSNQSPPPLIMIGMHRSGTSLAASLLESSGVHVGERLMEANWSNPRGHFEDMDFVELHRGALVRLGVHRDGWTTSELPEFSQDLVEAAAALVARKASSGRAWGWKDPRTILFLRLWLDLLPEARLVLIYRAPWEVIDSLYRRGDEVFAHDPEFAVVMWQRYNRALLDAMHAAPERSLLVSLETLANYPRQWVARVGALANLTLRDPDESLYAPELLHGAGAQARVGALFRHYPEVLELYAALESRAWNPPEVEPPPPWTRGPTLEVERRLAIDDWHKSCALGAECERLRNELRIAADALNRAPPHAAPRDGEAVEGA